MPMDPMDGSDGWSAEPERAIKTREANTEGGKVS